MNETPQQAARRLAAGALREGFKPQALHEYTDTDGTPVHWRIRLKNPDTGDKWVRPMKLNGEGYALGEPDYPEGKPLYRLRDLATRPDDPVIVCEGEWCADSLTKVGVLATTSGAADSAGKTDWRALAGRSVTIWPDNDEAGRRYADAVAAALWALGCTVFIIDVVALNLPPKGDAVDWLMTHPDATVADIAALAANEAPRQTYPVSPQQGDSVSETVNSGAQKDDDAETIMRLAAMSPLEYDRNRKEIAKSIGVRPATLDKMVIAERKENSDDDMGFPDVEPWTSPVDPGALLSEISMTLRRFIVCQQETADAVALWVAMTWFMDVVQVAPLAVITAPEKRCGKSQLLFLLGKLSYRPLTASNISPAALFRAVDAWKPTLLVDEADAFMRDNEELRGIINAGHTRDSAYVVRTVGDDFTPTRFSVWGAKALAGIGHLADTLMDRAIVLELRRKLPDESTERLRHAEPELFDTLAEKLARFADDCRDAVRHARPELPASLNDRAQDNWEPLLAIADIAGGEWTTLSRKAALKLSGTDAPTLSTGTELLADIQEVFEAKKVDKISTAQLIEALCAEDERPWATYNRGKPITPRQVSKRLGEYGISSTTIRVGLETPKGFRRDMFDEVFSRYLVALPLPYATTPQASSSAGLDVADHSPRCGNGTPSETRKPLRHKACGGVADAGGDSGEVIEVEV